MTFVGVEAVKVNDGALRLVETKIVNKNKVLVGFPFMKNLTHDQIKDYLVFEGIVNEEDIIGYSVFIN